jgi:hypothetical protein
MDILKMSKNRFYEIIFFCVTEKLFSKNPKWQQSILGKRNERWQKVIFEKNSKKSEKIQKSPKISETSLRRLKTPT